MGFDVADMSNGRVSVDCKVRVDGSIDRVNYWEVPRQNYKLSKVPCSD